MDQGHTLHLIPYGIQEVEIEEEDDNESLTLSSALENETSECSSSPATYPPFPTQPKTPRESMEFLCRSWSLSTSEMSLALSSHKSNKQLNPSPKLHQLADVTSPAPAPLPPALLSYLALRGEAALRERLPQEAKNNAAISPCERSLPETRDCSSELDSSSTIDEQTSVQEVEESKLDCNGELMQCARNGVLRWKNIKVYINKKSQVVVEIKSKHVGGAFSMKSKGIVNEVCETVSALKDPEEELFFGISTGKGLTKFKCKSKSDKQTWVDSIRNLLQQVTAV